jgi:hypothetical protein
LVVSVLLPGSSKSLAGSGHEPGIQIVAANVLPELTPEQQVVGERTVRRVVFLTPALGVVAGLIAAFLHRRDWAEGLILGTILGWLNFRWLRRGLEAFTSAAAAPPGQEGRQTPAPTYLAAIFRYVLIGAAVYVIFMFLHVPLVSIVLGLCTLAVAILTASVWEIVQSSAKRS